MNDFWSDLPKKRQLRPWVKAVLFVAETFLLLGAAALSVWLALAFASAFGE